MKRSLVLRNEPLTDRASCFSVKERIDCDDQFIHVLSASGSEGLFYFIRTTGVEEPSFYSETASRALYIRPSILPDCLGLIKIPKIFAVGTSSLSNSSFLGPSPWPKLVAPVICPPGR